METLSGIFVSWLVLSFAVWVAATVLDGVTVRDAKSVIVVAALFGVLNFFLGWLFFAIFAIGTFGIALLLAFITRWIVDAIILKIVDSMSDRISIDGFGSAFLAALIMAFVGSVGQWVLQMAGIMVTGSPDGFAP